MDDNNRNINGSEPEKKDSGFNFVQEKVKSKRRKRVKRILLIFGLTIVCAVLFGFIARFVFVKSEGLFNSVMGVTVTPTPAETQRQQVALPTATPTPEVTAVPTEQPTATPTPTEEATPSVSAGDSGEDAEVGGEGEAPEEEPESALIQYAQMISGMKDVVTKVSGALLPVTAITTDVNWLDEIVTSEYRFSSLVMGDNGVELLLLATCYDRLKDADELLVELSPGVIVDAKVFGYDEDYNLAILAVLNKNLPDSMLEGLQTVELGSSASVAAGLPVIALGSPNGVNGSLAYGFVTLTGDTAYVTDGKVDLFYTDAGNIANGEGIIVNLEGQLVGIITRSLKSKKMVDSCTVAGVSSVEKVILNLLNRVDRPYLGVLAEDIPAEDLKRLDLENGIYVCDVVSGSPADAAGIKKGDVITEIKLAGIEEPAHIRSVSGYMAAVAQTTVGDEVAIGIYRTSSAENTAFEVTAVIGKK